MIALPRQLKEQYRRLDLRAYTMIAALVTIWLTFAVVTESFLTPRNLSNLFLQTSVTAILAIGMTLIIVAGHIDLSIGSLVGLTGGLAAILQVWHHWPTWMVIPVALVFGAVIGLFQGWWVAVVGVPAFIVTLGGTMVMRGALMGLTRGSTIAPLHPSFTWIGKAYLAPSLAWGIGILAAIVLVGLAWKKGKWAIAKATGFSALLLGFIAVLASYRGIPVPLVLVAILAGLFFFVTRHTPFGRHVYAIGGNLEAARLSGIPIQKRVLGIFLLNGLLGGIASIVLTARVNAATISAGQMYELDAIAACVIGGTSLMGGVGTIPGALIGALVMASLDNGMSLLNLETFWQYIAKGTILVLAVCADILSRKRQSMR